MILAFPAPRGSFAYLDLMVQCLAAQCHGAFGSGSGPGSTQPPSPISPCEDPQAAQPGLPCTGVSQQAMPVALQMWFVDNIPGDRLGQVKVRPASASLRGTLTRGGKDESRVY